MLADLIAELTTPYRKGEVVKERVLAGVKVTEIFGYDKTPEGASSPVDLHFINVVVHPEAGGRYQAVRDALSAECPDLDRLTQGPSYIEVGGWLGDQELALRLFALGQAYGWWKVITPALMGFTGEEADAMAGSGFVMVSGFREPARTAEASSDKQESR